MKKYFLIQRRKAIRANYPDENIELTTLGSSSSYECKGEDISVKGIRVRTLNDNLPVGTPVTITFHILVQDEIEEVTAEGVVVWQKEITRKENLKEKYRLGIKFQGLNLRVQDAISQYIAPDKISEEQKAEYQHLRREIHNCISNLLKITLAVNGATLTFLGVSLAHQNPFLPLIPLLIIELGFRLFKLQLEKMRRIATYIRCFFESQVRDLKWEDYLYSLREIVHLGEKAYSIKEYYNTAKYLGSICFIIGIYWVCIYSDLSFQSYIVKGEIRLLWMIYLFAGFWWFTLSLPRIGKESVWLKGASSFEKEFYCFWNQIKRYKEGFCSDFDHLRKILRILSGRENLKSIQDLKELEKDEKKCFYSKSCPLNSKVRNLMHRFRKLGNNQAHLRRKNTLYIFAILTILFLIIFLPVSLAITLFKYDIFIWHTNPIVCLGTGLLCIELLLGMIVIKVRIRNKYYRSLKKDGRETLVRCDWLQQSNNIDSSEDKILQFPPLNYIEPKTVPLLSWIFYYGMKKTWARNKVCFLREKWGKSSKDFIQDMWKE